MKFNKLKLILLAILFIIPRIQGTNSFYVDTETTSSIMAAGTWEVEESVIINEIMWIGSSSSSNDEWLELRNITNAPIDLNRWKLINAGVGTSDIILTGSIPANGYYLVSYYAASHPQSSLSDSIIVDQVEENISFIDNGEVITLVDSSNKTIDQTPSDTWATGANGPPSWKSMERNEDPDTGWHQCDDPDCNDTSFWDTEDSNYGTPKTVNLSVYGSHTPSLTFNKDSSSHTVSFVVTNIENYDELEYVIEYPTAQSHEGIVGSHTLHNETEFRKDNIFLGTCSSTEGRVCIEHDIIGDIELTVTLHNTSESNILTTKILSY